MTALAFVIAATAGQAECLARFPHRAPDSARAYFNTFDGFFDEVGVARGVEPALLKAVAYCETRFDPCAVSAGAGARGLMQFVESTFAQVAPAAKARDPFDPRDSIRSAGLYLAALTNFWRGDLQAVVASYNADPRQSFWRDARGGRFRTSPRPPPMSHASPTPRPGSRRGQRNQKPSRCSARFSIGQHADAPSANKGEMK